MRLRELLAVLQSIAPEHLAESWDKAGLQIGDPEQAVDRGLLCVDLTRAVLDEAVRLRVSLIVAYHPPIFDPISAIGTGRDADRVGHTITQAIRRSVAIYSPHTALDAAIDGLNDWLAQRIGGAGTVVRPIVPVGSVPGAFKVIVFTPLDHAGAVRSAMAAACAGRIGNYTECSFNVRGEGTFRPGKGARPFIGARGRLERVEEVRTEMLCPAGDLSAVIAALRRAHPYEEPAFDIVRVEPAPWLKTGDGGAQAGQGRLARLTAPIRVDELVARAKRVLRVKGVDVATPAGSSSRRQVRTLAIAAGAGGSLLRKAGPCDAWITGELRHHEVLAAIDAGKVVITAGHTQTERPFLPTYARRLARATGPAVRWLVSQADRPPSTRR